MRIEKYEVIKKIRRLLKIQPSERVHYWLKIEPACGPGFICLDDGFGAKAKQYVHTEDPRPKGYTGRYLRIPFGAECDNVVTPYDEYGNPVKINSTR